MPIKGQPAFYRIARRVSVNVSLFAVLSFGSINSTADSTFTAPKVSLVALGTPITAEIYPQQTKTFEFSTASNEYVHISIEKGDLRLSAVVYDREHQKYADITSQCYEAVETSFISRGTGTYRLEIRSLEIEQGARRFQIRIHSAPIGSSDVKEVAAHHLVASASRLGGEWNATSLREAIARYVEARSLWQSVKKPREAANASLKAGEIHFALGEYRQSLSCLQHAASDLRKVNDLVGESRAFSRSAQIYSLLGDNNKARRLSSTALQYFSSFATASLTNILRHVYAEALANAGEVDYAIGDLSSALNQFQKSLRLFMQVGDRIGEVRSRFFLGYISNTTGDMSGAKEQFERCLELSRETGNRMFEGLSLTAIGTADSFAGEEELAIKMHREAMEIFRLIGNRQSEAVTLNGIGQAYQNLNRTDAALDYYTQALKVFDENENWDHVSAVLYQLGKVYYAAGNTTRAESFYTRSLNVSRASGKQRMLAYVLNDLAALHISQGRRQLAMTEYRDVLRVYQRIGDARGQSFVFNNQGDFFLRIGNNLAAVAAYKRAVPLSHRAADRGLEISTLYNVALAEQRLGNLQEALVTVKAAIELIEKQRSHFASPDFRSSYFSSQRKSYDLYIDLLMQLDRQQPEKDFAAAALVASENARARSLCEILAETGKDIRDGAQPAILHRERQLETLLRTAAYREQEFPPGVDSSSSPKLDVVRAEYDEIQSELRKENPRYEELAHPKALTMTEIQAELRDDNTLLLEYALGNERSYLWSVTADSVKGHILPGRESLEAAARDVYETLVSRQVSNGQIDIGYQAKVEAADKQYFKKALDLSRMLLGPVAKELGKKRLVIVSEGVLQYVPFDALPDPDGGAQTLDSLLISSNEVVTLPSISALAAIRAAHRQVSSSGRTVAIFADPVLSDLDERLRTRAGNAFSTRSDSATVFTMSVAGRVSANGLMRLTHASEEANAIAAVVPWNTWIATGFEANRDKVLSNKLAGYKILHFATHGIINPVHPELSGLLFSMTRPDGSPQNGYLQLHDIYNMKLSADLTVLSACDTALGQDVKAEGLIGLTRGFMYAGSRSVVASLWKVDDRATSVLMKHFYQKMLKDGLPPAAALRSAKEVVRKEPEWRAPYFWAGFVIQGEYREPIAMDQDRRLQNVLRFLAVLLFVAAIFTLITRYGSSRRRL